MLIEIDGWKVGLRFSATHFIPKHPKCGRLHGHTYTVHTRIYGEIAESRYILDFGIIKDALRKVIRELDHAVLIPAKSHEIEIVEDEERNEVEVKVRADGKRYIFPRDDVNLIDIESATAEDLVLYILKKLLALQELPGNVSKIELGLDEGWGQGVWAEKEL